jgi:hypothetical protein
MACISRNNLSSLTYSIGILKVRHRTLYPISLTHDELLELFAPPEHWELLRTAADIAEVRAASNYKTIKFTDDRLRDTCFQNHVTLCFTANDVGGKAPLMPVNNNLLRANTALVDRLVAWSTSRVTLGYEYGVTAALLNWLSENCDSPKQIRYLWPSLLTLCALNEQTKELGDNLREVKAPQSLPALPLEVRRALRSSAKTIAIASLIGTDQAEPKLLPVSVELYNAGMRQMDPFGYVSPV